MTPDTVAQIRDDDRELLNAMDNLHVAQVRAMRALINRITVISMADQLDVEQLRIEVAHIRELLETHSTTARVHDFDEGHP